ncbi:AmmeMemoRadiSam system radical SAM enzyme [Thermosyntropha sp.]|uniref:AmmeMemoRadiSam system radical SAM enzyme n=1 Tax=Thermosyntropha sp. TaxID=2740820 RepID=UPI0025F1F224|nr:AmmeMemoRadiSam system radical SAM enzyme [Thermosyntropha sp.]MBO8158078.1 AmmeMemoRadiSam system radical SAM enzyme [Thermosyntropha sp.]
MIKIKEALFYERLEEDKVKCLLCPHECRIMPGRTGICRMRRNLEGKLVSLNYGRLAALALDPIEKKPFYHFYPGKNILSAGTAGCNFSCGFCQNYHLAHEIPDLYEVDLSGLVAVTMDAQRKDSIGLAFTYNEPLIWYEYVLETAEILKNENLKTVLVTNGYIKKKPLKRLLPCIDALNIDVKAFTDEFYRRNCRGDLKTVMQTVEEAALTGHVEITTLIIPGENDSEEELRNLSRWLAELNPDIPLHFSRYYPAYKFTSSPTPEGTLKKARDIAKEYLNFVYLGNLPGEQNNTPCLNCGNILIKRDGYKTQFVNFENGKCRSCGAEAYYIKM